MNDLWKLKIYDKGETSSSSSTVSSNSETEYSTPSSVQTGTSSSIEVDHQSQGPPEENPSSGIHFLIQILNIEAVVAVSVLTVLLLLLTGIALALFWYIRKKKESL